MKLGNAFLFNNILIDALLLTTRNIVNEYFIH